MSRTFKSILAPTDFSEASRTGVDYAISLAGPGTRVILCHVVDDVPLTYGYVGAYAVAPEIRSRLAEGAAQELETFISQPGGNVQLERRILHGSPFVEIIKLAREEDVDLIVMGTHGRTGLKHILIGSVAEKVVRKAHCPVLVVRSAEEAFEKP